MSRIDLEREYWDKAALDPDEEILDKLKDLGVIS